MKRYWLLMLCFVLPAWAQQQLSLQEARILALQNNTAVLAANAAEKAAKLDRMGAATHFLPAVSAAGNAQYIHNPFVFDTPDMAMPVSDAQGNIIVVTDGNGSPVLDANGDVIVKNWAVLPSQRIEIGKNPNAVFVVGLEQPVFTGGKVMAQYKARKAMYYAASANAEKIRQEVLLKTDESYWRVKELQEKVTLAETYAGLIEKHLHDVQCLVQEGIVTPNVALTVEVKKYEADMMLLKARNGLRLSKMDLCRIIGLPLDNNISPTEPLSVDADTAAAKVQVRPECVMARQAVALAKADAVLKRSRYFPNVFFHAEYAWMNPNPWNSLVHEYGHDWSLGVVMQWDLFHWNERGFTLGAARQRMKAASHAAEEVRNLVQLEQKQARFSVGESFQQITAAQSFMNAAQKNLDIVQHRFSEGLASSTDVLEAQTMWQKARCEIIEAGINERIASAKLKKALGVL